VLRQQLSRLSKAKHPYAALSIYPLAGVDRIERLSCEVSGLSGGPYVPEPVRISYESGKLLPWLLLYHPMNPYGSFEYSVNKR
jgi:hypothetical protein